MGDHISIGEKIKKRRLELEMTLEEVADKIGVTRQTMSRYETGVIKSYTPERISDIATALKTTSSFLLGTSESFRVSPSNEDPIPIYLEDGTLIISSEAPELVTAEHYREKALRILNSVILDICGETKSIVSKTGEKITFPDEKCVEIIAEFINKNSSLLKAQIEKETKRN